MSWCGSCFICCHCATYLPGGKDMCDYTSSFTHKGPPYLEDLTAVRGTVNVLAGLVHAKRHAVEQDHHDANPLEPRADGTGVKEHVGRRKTQTFVYTAQFNCALNTIHNHWIQPS
ncbi:hypothetical protein XENORESO_005601 [Xenotaenia resolanae]|uniref:Uncharacterized protein n=1 Tax=Xenotaenia resolanae TaxID=208358 RepID=A0ABV0WBI8_9TELE